MNFTISTQEFLKTLNIANKAFTPRPVNPIYSNFKLEVGENGLDITSSNGELSLITNIPLIKNNVQIIRDVLPGAILVKGDKLTKIITNLIDEEVTFQVLIDNIVEIRTKNSKYTLNCIRADEYMDIDFSLEGTKVTLDSKKFIDAVTQVAFCASQKQTKLALTGINLENNDGNICFTATDGSRLAKTTIEANTKDRFNINVPVKTMVEVARTIFNESEIDMYVGIRRIWFQLDHTLLTSTLIEGDYPRTSNIIPKNFSAKLEVNSQDFLNILNRVSSITDERENIVAITMNEMKVTVSTKASQVGSANEVLTNFKYSGEELTMAFNCDYVSSAIKALKSEDVVLNFVGQMKPFTVSTTNNPEVIQLITPVRVY